MKNSGNMPYRFEIQKPSKTRGPQGSIKKGPYISIGKRWGSLRTMTGNEVKNSGKQRADVQHVATMFYFEQINPKHRIVFNNRTMEITAVLHQDYRDDETRVACVEIFDDGIAKD